MSRREIAAAIAFVSTEEVKVENLKVTDVVALGRAPYTNWVGSLTEEDRAQVARALALVGDAGIRRQRASARSATVRGNG